MCIPQVLQYLVLIINYIFHYVILSALTAEPCLLYLSLCIIYVCWCVNITYLITFLFLWFHPHIITFLQSLFFYIIDFVFSFHQFSFPEIASRIKPDTIVWFWLDKDYKGEHTGAPFSYS